MNRRTKLVVTIGLITVMVVMSLLIYQHATINPAGSSVAWQLPIENFATALAADDGKVFTMDISGNVNCYDAQTGDLLWEGDSVGGYFARGLTVGEGKVYGGYRYASVGCLDEESGQLLWNRMYTAGVNQAPDHLIVKDGRLFVVSKGPGAGVTALNASTGEALWQAQYRFDIFGNITDSKTWWVAG